jgi:Flp pilus assembly protein TadG
MRRGEDRGSVTVELAMTLPAVVSLVAVLAGVGAAVSQQLQLADGARVGARVAALGQTNAAVTSAASEAAGGSVQVGVEREGGLVSVTCRRQVDVPLLGSRTMAARAVAACEPSRGCGATFAG